MAIRFSRLIFLSKSHPVGEILLIAMALVASVRVSAYYNEALSSDLAKMFPFALLAVFLVDMSLFSYGETFETLKQVPSMWKQLVYYLGFTITLEVVLAI